ncbi:hypothetical protein R5W24_005322 [Gemmata sp. JC717]|uniref:hypothetical protein n=1 Tax=Gemmata algarum TaxID=2975278 RepID=UPI0021BAAB09|nr:hypothetical protein [Gemmata algarum]MDY3556159.1 hypothetical protein [Gemmata algarum]
MNQTIDESGRDQVPRRPTGVPVLDAESCRPLGHTEADLAFFQTHQPVCGSPPKDEGASAALGERITALPKQCWFNARRAVMTLKDWAGASYVEGWAVCDSGLWIEHGWLVRDGVTVDPTLPTEVDAYFPGLEFRGRDEITAFLATPRGKKCRRSPFLYAYGWGGGYSPTMRKAQADATAYALARFRDGIFVSPSPPTTVGGAA